MHTLVDSLCRIFALMSSISTNERELASKLTEWFNDQIRRGDYPFKEAHNETGVKSKEKTRFADITLWINRASKEAYTYIEIKPPHGAKESIKTLTEKAVSLKVKYAFTWNFQVLNVYKVKGTVLELISTDPHPLFSSIEMWMRGDIQASIKAYIRRICDYAVTLNETGKIVSYVPDKIFFVKLFRDVSGSLITLFESYYKGLGKDRKKRQLLDKYLVEQGLEVKDYKDHILAGQRVYRLLITIIFYQALRRVHKHLPDLYESQQANIEDTLRVAFSEARKIDWQAIFVEDDLDSLGIPIECYSILEELIGELRAYHFASLPEDVLGELFQDIIDPEERHSLGQYFTPEDLVDLVIATAVNDADGQYLDPTCGSGTFLIRLYDRLKFLDSNRKSFDKRLQGIWGFDIAGFPAALSTINLARQDVSNTTGFPQVQRENFFDVHQMKEYIFPLPYDIDEKVTIPVLPFHGIVGNYPYIRQELIEKNDKGAKKRLTKLIAKEFLFSYEKLFEFKGIDSKKLQQLVSLPQEKRDSKIDELVETESISLRLSGKADIYAYLFIHATTHLREGGTQSIITSNSWLDASYGTVLKEFLLDHYKVKMVIGSYAEPWFEDAAVNTVITVLERCSDPVERKRNKTHFVKLLQPLAELVKTKDLYDTTRRWRELDDIVTWIENSSLRAKKLTETLDVLEDQRMRIRLIEQDMLLHELGKLGDQAKWGKYLRAPDVYFDFLEKVKDKLVPLEKIADVRFGVKTGINDFFYVSELSQKDKVTIYTNDAGWTGELESKFLKKAIKDCSKFEKIDIQEEDISEYLFFCNSSKSELRKKGDHKAYAYIEWGENQVGKSSIPYPQVASVKGRKDWHTIPTVVDDEILYLAAPRNRFLAFWNEHHFAVDKRLYAIKPKKKSVLAILNSFINVLHIEAYGREINNGNVKEFTVVDVENMLVPDVEIDYDMKKISSRVIKPIFEEVKKKDRIELDSAVLRALGLEPDEWLPRIYKGITDTVGERLELPKMRSKRKKQGVKESWDVIKNSIISSHNGRLKKRFPEDFWYPISSEYSTIVTRNHKMTFESFLGHYEVKSIDGTLTIGTYDVLEQAEFIAFASQKGTMQVQIPKSVEKVIEIVDQYKAHLQSIKNSATEEARLKVHDYLLADKMAKEIFDEFGMPYEF